MKTVGVVLLRIVLAIGVWLLTVIYFKALEHPLFDLLYDLQIDKEAFVGLGVLIGLPVALVYLFLPLFRQRRAADAAAPAVSPWPRRWRTAGRLVAVFLVIPIVGGIGTAAMLIADGLALGQPNVCDSVRFGAVGLLMISVGILLPLPLLVRFIPKRVLWAAVPVYLLFWAGAVWLAYDPLGNLQRRFETAVRDEVTAPAAPATDAIALSLRFRQGQTFTITTTGVVTEFGSAGGCARWIGGHTTELTEVSRFTVRRVGRDGTASIEWRIASLRMKQMIDGKVVSEVDTSNPSSLQRAAADNLYDPAMLQAVIEIEWASTGEVQIRAVRNVSPESADAIRRILENRRYFDRSAFPPDPVRQGQTWQGGQITSFAMKVSGRYRYALAGELRGLDATNRSVALLHYRAVDGQSVDNPDQPVTGRVEKIRNEAEIAFALDRGLPERATSVSWTRARVSRAGRPGMLVEVLVRVRAEWRIEGR
jgi:hypothetical protein